MAIQTFGRSGILSVAPSTSEFLVIGPIPRGAHIDAVTLTVSSSAIGSATFEATFCGSPDPTDANLVGGSSIFSNGETVNNRRRYPLAFAANTLQQLVFPCARDIPADRQWLVVRIDETAATSSPDFVVGVSGSLNTKATPGIRRGLPTDQLPGAVGGEAGGAGGVGIGHAVTI